MQTSCLSIGNIWKVKTLHWLFWHNLHHTQMIFFLGNFKIRSHSGLLKKSRAQSKVKAGIVCTSPMVEVCATDNVIKWTLAGSVVLLLLHLLPPAASSRSSGSRSHSFAPRFSPVETVSSYAFARKIRHPCGFSVMKRSISSEMEEQQEQQQQSRTPSLLIKLFNLFSKSIGSSSQEGENHLTSTGDLIREQKMNSTSSFKAQLARLRALKWMPIRRNGPESSSTANLEMRRNLLAAIARLASEVTDAIPMTVS